jgi:hypothetical protein
MQLVTRFESLKVYPNRRNVVTDAIINTLGIYRIVYEWTYPVPSQGRLSKAYLVVLDRIEKE